VFLGIGTVGFVMRLGYIVVDITSVVGCCFTICFLPIWTPIKIKPAIAANPNITNNKTFTQLVGSEVGVCVCGLNGGVFG